MYADLIALLSGSCRGLQKMLDIRSDFGREWDIRFNPLKSQLLPIGGDNPPDCQLLLDNKPVQWCVRVKYLGIYLLAGKTVKIDLTVTKSKYYGCYNSITSVCGKQRNETVTLHLVKCKDIVYQDYYMLVKSCPSAVCKHMNWILYGTTLFDVFLTVSGGKM